MRWHVTGSTAGLVKSLVVQLVRQSIVGSDTLVLAELAAPATAGTFQSAAPALQQGSVVDNGGFKYFLTAGAQVGVAVGTRAQLNAVQLFCTRTGV